MEHLCCCNPSCTAHQKLPYQVVKGWRFKSVAVKQLQRGMSCIHCSVAAGLKVGCPCDALWQYCRVAVTDAVALCFTMIVACSGSVFGGNAADHLQRCIAWH